jgi:hypothetical protein
MSESTSRRWIARSVGAGIALAAVYTFSPLTVWVAGLTGLVIATAGRGLPTAERRTLSAVIGLALAARVCAVAAMFFINMPIHDDQFVGAATGDEAYTEARALRTRDILLGNGGNKYDYVVAHDEYGRNSYLSLLTAIQVVFGPSPYAVRFLNAVLFTIGGVVLFRMTRPTLGAFPAFAALSFVLFLPSLFVWSISLLKESLYFFGTALVLVGVVGAIRCRTWLTRAAAAVSAVGAAAIIRDVRAGALVLTAGGLMIGLGAYGLTRSKKATVFAAIAAAIGIPLLLSQPLIARQITAGLEAAARTHTGHVFTVGHAYKLLDDGFYLNPQTPAASTLTLTRGEAARFVIRAAVSFVTVPAPWQLQSRRELLYWPEQALWYALIVLLPVGAVAGWRRDPLVTCLLVGYVVPTAAALALTNGNVGTLLRLRGLVIPYVACVSATGFCGLASRSKLLQVST